MSLTVALAGDTMLGRGVAERLSTAGPRALVAEQVREITAAADLFLLNLECCISERGERWPAPGKPFFFRAPPVAVETLSWLGVDAVTLANNHALDFGAEALEDTLDHLAAAGIAVAGAGLDETRARAPAVLQARGRRLGVLGITDHPADFASGPDRPGVAFADLSAGTPEWLLDAVRQLRDEVDAVLVTPHWGPNMVAEPVRHVRAAAPALRAAGADLVAGHSAHVPHGVADGICYDLGDFVDDYAVHPELRNDLGLLFLVVLDEDGTAGVSAVPLALDFCHTRLAVGEEYTWLRDRFGAACAALGTEMTTDEDGHLVVHWR
ncbi:MAG: CapA family protein [Actinomycetota bacterium]|nr:CapA family protein [Actinomycetota bacterium]